MELAPVPRRRPWSVRARTMLLIAVVAPVTLLALLPAAFGLERYTLTSDVPGSAARGSVVLARDVPVGDLREGDLVTFATDGAPTSPSGLTTGRVTTVRGDEVIARVGEGREVTLGDRTTATRSLVVVPLVGYPFLGGALSKVLGLVAVLAGLALGLVFLRDAWRPTRRSDTSRDHRPGRRDVRVPARTAG